MESAAGGNTVIDYDLPCVHCRYNLRTLPTDGKCPECGTAIARSTRGEALAAADGRWRRGLATGLMLLALGLGGWIMLQVIYGQGMDHVRVTRITLAGVVVACSIGIWLVTESEPDPLVPERPWNRRRMVRWGALAVVASYVASPWLGMQEALYAPQHGARWLALWGMMGVVVVVFFLLALHAGELMRRAGKRSVMWLWRMTGIMGLAGGGMCLSPIFRPAPADDVSSSLLPLAITLVPVVAAMFMAGLLGVTAWEVRFGKNHVAS